MYRITSLKKYFYGRLAVQNAGSAFYFTKDSVIQDLIIQLKYKNNPRAGNFLGKLLGRQLINSSRFNDVDVIIPLPLNEIKLFKRGYNQTLLLLMALFQFGINQ